MWQTLNPSVYSLQSKIRRAVEVDMPAQTRGRLDGMWVVSGGGGGHLAGGQGRPRGTRGILSGCPLNQDNPRTWKITLEQKTLPSPLSTKIWQVLRWGAWGDQDIRSQKIAFPPHRLDTHYPHKFTVRELLLPFAICQMSSRGVFKRKLFAAKNQVSHGYRSHAHGKKTSNF